MQNPFLASDHSPSPSAMDGKSKWRNKMLKSSQKSTPPKSVYQVDSSLFKSMPYTPTSHKSKSSPIFIPSLSPPKTPNSTNPYRNLNTTSSSSSISLTPISGTSSLDLASSHPPSSTHDNSPPWTFSTPPTAPDTTRTSVFKSPLFFKGKSDQLPTIFTNTTTTPPTLLHHNPKHNFAPKVKPYITTQMGISSPTPRLDDRCTICEELMQTRLECERPLTLSCGDLIHEECFQVTLEYEIERLFENHIINEKSTLDDVLHHIYFQYCEGYNCQKKNAKSQILPVDKSLYYDRIYQFLSAMKAKSPNKKSNNIQALNSTLRGSKIQAKDFFDPKVIHSPTPIKANDAPGRYSVFNSIASHSRSPSPTQSISTINTASITISAHLHSSLDELRNYFIRHLLDTCPSFSLSNLLKLGSLRLVDKLQVSFSIKPNLHFESKLVYLFENYILIWLQNSPVVLFATDNIQIDTTPSPSILTIKIKNMQNSIISELSLTSDTSSIIEKWVIGVSDLKFSFPSEIFSSTISMPQKTLDPKILSTSSVIGNGSEAVFTDRNNDPEIEDDDSDLDSDDELIKDALNYNNTGLSLNSTKINKMFSLQNPDEADKGYEVSDEDSDQEKINEFLNNNGWNEIIAHIDNALSNSKHY